MDRPRLSHAPFALVVEAHKLVRLDTVTILEEAGFRVLDVPSSEDAIRLLDVHGRELALLFTAVHLEGRHDGFALARMAASDHANLSIVVTSGLQTPGPGDLPDTACFIPKPFSTEIVHEHLRRIIPIERKPASLG